VAATKKVVPLLVSNVDTRIAYSSPEKTGVLSVNTISSAAGAFRPQNRDPRYHPDIFDILAQDIPGMCPSLIPPSPAFRVLTKGNHTYTVTYLPTGAFFVVTLTPHHAFTDHELEWIFTEASRERRWLASAQPRLNDGLVLYGCNSLELVGQNQQEERGLFASALTAASNAGLDSVCFVIDPVHAHDDMSQIAQTAPQVNLDRTMLPLWTGFVFAVFAF